MGRGLVGEDGPQTSLPLLMTNRPPIAIGREGIVVPPEALSSGSFGDRAVFRQLREGESMGHLDEIVKPSIAYLSSDEALNSLERDPYWPKWDSPWWHMLLLHELGLSSEIPEVSILKLVKKLKTHYLDTFPVREEELPPGVDPYRQIMCFCALGSVYQLLHGCGVDLESELPWMRPWFTAYQLPDGGLNCDEAAYTKSNPKSSIVSTVPCLEAILYCHWGGLSDEEVEFLDRGARYLIQHGLFRRVSDGKVINPDWLEIRFPRFYEYDYLRGYCFLARWRRKSGFPIPEELTDEVKRLVTRQLSASGDIVLDRYHQPEDRSYNPQPDGSWQMGPVSEFDLMKQVSSKGLVCPPLTKAFEEAGLC